MSWGYKTYLWGDYTPDELSPEDRRQMARGGWALFAASLSVWVIVIVVKVLS